MIPAITEVNFPSYATLHQATVSLQDMGDRVISTQVRIDGDVVPDFGGWELRFKGERFVLPSDNPQAMKDNTTRNSLVDLQFQSWAIQELKRYYFFETASVSAGVAIADKYVTPVRLNVEDFVAMLNDVLDYYFDGKIVADLYLSGTGIYSQEKKDMEINYSYLWEVIGKVFEVYGVRNVIEYDSTNDVYTIKFGYPADEIDDHTFEYGYQGGLLKFERQVQDETISNILLGRGGEKNLPYRYFKAIDPQNPEWAADPDAIPELANIYFDRLRDINFRRYVQGWRTNPNRDTSWEAVQTYDAARGATDWAYKKGHEDERFSPVEYVKDDESIAAYGEHWGALDDNDEIYPTIQGRSRTGLGRIDEVVAVSPIITDDIDAMAQASAVEKSISSLTVSKYGSTETTHTIESEEFTIPEGSTGGITYAWVDKETIYKGSVYCDTVRSTLVAVSTADGTELPINGIPAGTYRLRLSLVISIDSPATSATGTFGIENIVLTTSAQDDEAWKPTFDIWVKDIWGIAREQGESDAQYAMRVWGPILGDRVGNEAKVVFSTGFMSVSEDYEFTIADYPVPDTTKTLNNVPSAWRITLRKSDAEYDATGLYIPNNSTGGKPIAGDKFFFTGIDMPHLYVTLAEEELNTFKSAQLQGTSAVNPTWVISLDKVRVHTLEDGEYGQTLAERLAAGAKLKVSDPRFSGGDILTLYAQSVTYTWNEPSDGSPYLVPDIEVVLSDQVVSRESRVDKIQSSVDQIKSQYARIDDVESVVRKVAEPMFLKKTGEADSSDSPTQFASKISSRGFRQGGVGGAGWGIYRDNTEQFRDAGTPASTRSRSTRAVSTETEEGDTVLEVDRVVVRKEMQVNSLVVNQVEYRGGMEIISAAKIEISKVIDDDANGVYVCYFDQRQNSVANNFQVGDVAYGHVFTPNDSTLRYYKCRVVGVDVDRIMLSKTVKDGAGVPQAGDVVVQFGSYTNSARRYVIVRDVVGGGYEQMLSGLDSVTASGEEYYYAGRTNGQSPRWFVGDAGGEYAEWKNGQLNIKGSVLVKNGSSYTDMSTALGDLDYLTTALPESSTLIDGGLILSKVIALTDANNNIQSGINGVPSLSSIAAWYGGPMADKEATPTPQNYAKSLFRFDGSGYLAGGKITWADTGAGSIPGVSWSADGSSIVIDGGVKLASSSGDTITELLSAVQAISNWFVEDTVNGVKYLKLKTAIGGIQGFATEGFISAGGVSSGGGASGTTLDAVWASFMGNTDGHANDKINAYHIPIGSGLEVDTSGSTPVIKAIGAVTSVVGQTGAVTAQQISTALNLGDAAEYGVASTVSAGDTTHLVTGAAVASAVSSVLKYKGTTTTNISDGSTTNPITIGGDSYTAVTGDVVIKSGTGKEFLWNGSSWEEMGDEASWALKTITITGTGYLTGGGTLESNRTIDIAQTYKGYIDEGHTVAGYFDANGKITSSHLPSMYIGRTEVTFSAANATLLGITAISNAASSGSSDLSRIVWDADHDAWHFQGNIYADGFISAGGISQGGGGSGVTLSAVWDSLKGNSDSYADDKINPAHILTSDATATAGLIIGSGLNYNSSTRTLTAVGTVTSVAGKTGAVTLVASDISDWSTATSGFLTTAVTSLASKTGAITIDTDSLSMSSAGQLSVKASTFQPLDADLTAIAGLSGTTGLLKKTAANTWSLDTNSYYYSGNFVEGTNYQAPIPANTYHPYQGSSSLKMIASYFTFGQNYTPSGGSATESKLEWDNTNKAWHLIGNFYADGWVSAGGVSSGGGTGGIDPLAMWRLLTNDNSLTTYDDNTKIHTAHLPTLSAGTGLTASYTQTSATSTTLNLGINASQISAAIGLGDYLPLSAGSSKPLTGALYVGGTFGNKVVLETASGGDNWCNILYWPSSGKYWSVGAGADTFYWYKYASGETSSTIMSLDRSGYLTAAGFKVGTSTGFLKANGTVDSTSYLPLTGGNMTGSIWRKMNVDTDNYENAIGWRKKADDTVLATIGYYNTVQKVFINPIGSSNVYSDTVGKYSLVIGNNSLTYNTYTIYHSGNLTPGNFVTSVDAGDENHPYNLAITKGSGTTYITVPFATETKRFRFVQATSSGTDLNTVLTGGAVAYNYNSAAYWQNGPSGMSYGGVLQINSGGASDTLAMQLAWDVTHNVEDGTKNLWWRDRNNLGWGGWRLIYHSGNFIAGTNYQAPISAGTGITFSNNVVSVTANTYAPYLAAGYVSKAGDTITSTSNAPLTINSTYSNGQSVILFQSSGTNKSQVGYGNATYGTWMYDYATQAYINIPPSATTLYWKNSNPFYHSGNANLSTVSWTCGNLVSNGGVTVYNSTAHNYRWEINFSGELGRLYAIADNGSAYKNILINNTITVTSGYNVGIANTSPSYKLDVNSGSVGDAIRLTSTATYSCIVYTPSESGKNWSVGCNNIGQFYFYTNSATRAYFTQAGALVTTVATGTAPFTVSSTTLVSNLNVDLLDGVHSRDITSIYTGGWCSGSGNYYGKIAEYISASSGTVDFTATFLVTDYNVSGAASGNILAIRCRSNSPTSTPTINASWANQNSAMDLYVRYQISGGLLYVRVYVYSTGWTRTINIKLLNAHGWGNQDVSKWNLYNAVYTGGAVQTYTSLPSAETAVTITVNNALTGNITASGSITATGAVTAGSASDARLKTNINTLSDEQAKALIMALRPVTFSWNKKATELYNEYKGNDVGFVAQEVETYFPKAIGTIFEKYKRLDQTKFIAPLVSVTQNHEKRIKELEAEVKRLNTENLRLRNKLNMN